MGLGLVQDRKELYKKRGKGGARRRRGRHGNSDDDSDDEEDGPQGSRVMRLVVCKQIPCCVVLIFETFRSLLSV